MKNILIFILFIFVFSISKAQDIHFSQFYNAPMLLNPALTGNMNCNLRAGMNYRRQGSAFGLPYTTQSGFFDYKFYPGFLNNDWMGIGMNAYNDKSGNGALSNSKGMLYFSYSKTFNKENSLLASIGFGVGAVNKSVSYYNLTFGNQWNGYTFSQNMTNKEKNYNPSLLYFNIAGGMLLSYSGKKIGFFGGLSLDHINKPKDSFYKQSTNQLGIKTIYHGGLSIKVTKDFIILPKFMIASQKEITETIIGSNFSYDYSDVKLIIGLWSRLGKDLIPTFGLGYRNWNMMFSYDYGTSNTVLDSDTQKGLEISITKIFCFSSKKQIRIIKYIPCPSFR